MKISFNNLMMGLLLFSSFFLYGCVDDEGTGPTTRGSATDSGDGSRTESDSGSGGGLGQDNSNSNSTDNDSASSSSSSKFAAMEQKAHDLVNEYRASKGLSALTLVEEISSVCRGHSEDMANGTVPFSHDGFDARGDVLKTTVGWSGIAENVAFNNGFSDPEQTAVTGWINSSGHEKNMRGNYTKTGMGVAQSADGSYYFTQIFIK